MKVTLTNEQLIEKVKQWVKKLCETGGHAWTLRVPVDFDNDPDMLITELCNRLKSQPTPSSGGWVRVETLNDYKEECDRLEKVAKFWQKEYYKINPGFIPPKIDNL